MALRSPYCLLFAVILSLTSYTDASAVEYSAEVDSLFAVLDHEIAIADTYNAALDRQIISIKEAADLDDANPLEAEYLMNDRLYNEFYAYQCDSTLKYVARNMAIARELGDDSRINHMLIKEARINASLGSFQTSVELLNHVQPNKLTHDGMVDYYEALSYVYRNIGASTNNDAYRLLADKISGQYADSIIRVLPRNTLTHLSYYEARTRNEGRLENALKINSRRLAKVEPDSRKFAQVNFDRAHIYSLLGDEDNRMKHLLISAIADIRSATRDNASLTLIAQELYDNDDINRAYKYITMAMDDAEAMNSPMRKRQNASLYRMIEKSYELEKANDRRNLVIIVLICALLIGTSFLHILYKRQEHRQRAIDNTMLRGQNAELTDQNAELSGQNAELTDQNAELSDQKAQLVESNSAKELYLCRLLELCSTYLEKLSDYRQDVLRKLSQKKYDQLMKQAQSTDFTREETEEFYENFDRAFIAMYPNFITEFNKLLTPEARTEISDGRLTPHMRIFALVRLGITNTADIAKLLHYSMSTIYNYRVKVNKMAIDPPKVFEEKIMQIDAF